MAGANRLDDNSMLPVALRRLCGWPSLRGAAVMKGQPMRNGKPRVAETASMSAIYEHYCAVSHQQNGVANILQQSVCCIEASQRQSNSSNQASTRAVDQPASVRDHERPPTVCASPILLGIDALATVVTTCGKK